MLHIIAGGSGTGKSTLLMQKIPESTDDSFLDSKFRTLLYISQRKRTQIQFCFQRGIHFPFVNGYRHWLRWL